MDKHVIMGIHLTDRIKKAGPLQQVFSEYGCHIKTRLGLHEAAHDRCAPNGVVLLECVGDDATLNNMENAIRAIEGVEVQKMVFKH